ncbi:hypothetical protein NXT3_PB00284 (plasmid) [Sinorhizobium fredii]|uniref:Uncharacterized protein n=1 Tax=Rhizobium fredii TaxID=380 RepID=A0A2L0HBR3_RHIFR|nr:hypothetical protein NXT3_PB00284 [Sinorhizobium fredii]
MTVAGHRQDDPRSDDGGRKRVRSDENRPQIPLRISGTNFSNRFSFCPAYQGKVAVAAPVPAAGTSFVSAKKRGRAVDTVRGGRER